MFGAPMMPPPIPAPMMAAGLPPPPHHPAMVGPHLGQHKGGPPLPSVWAAFYGGVPPGGADHIRLSQIHAPTP